jgi:hypothetical protein
MLVLLYNCKIDDDDEALKAEYFFINDDSVSGEKCAKLNKVVKSAP